MKAIIGGTGIDRDSRFYENAVAHVNRYGEVIYSIKDDIVYLPRHRPGHRLPPHRINYRANIAELRSLGVTDVISIYAVGSITKLIAPTRFGLIKDFIDFAFGRENTFYDGTEGPVRHVPFVAG